MWRRKVRLKPLIIIRIHYAIGMIFVFPPKLPWIYAAFYYVAINYLSFLLVRVMFVLQFYAQLSLPFTAIYWCAELPVLTRRQKHFVVAVTAPTAGQIFYVFPFSMKITGLYIHIQSAILRFEKKAVAGQ